MLSRNTLLIGIVIGGILMFLPYTFNVSILAQVSELSSVPEEITSKEITYYFLAAVLSGGGITVVGSVITLHLTNKASSRRMIDQHKLELEFKAKELQVKRDEGLRSIRINAYKGLWEHTQTWARYYRGERMTYADANTLLNNLHEWYFKFADGMFLSESNRKRLFNLKESLVPIADCILRSESDKGKVLNNEMLDNIINLCSELRKGLSEELGARKDFPSENSGKIDDAA